MYELWTSLDGEQKFVLIIVMLPVVFWFLDEFISFINYKKERIALNQKISQLNKEVAQLNKQMAHLKDVISDNNMELSMKNMTISELTTKSHEQQKSASELSKYKDMYAYYKNLHDKHSESLNTIASELSKYKDMYAYYKDLHDKRCESLNTIFTSNLSAFPYLAAIMADYKTWDLDIMIKELSWGNNVARKKKVTSLIEIKKETKTAIEKCKIAEYQLAYLKTLFPAIEDVIETDFRDLDASIDIADSDPIRKFLNHDEYYKLSESERNQLALDRYIESHQKSKWQIGRDYELYVGYKYSLSGYNINFFGSYMGLEDLGRDLIATKDEMVLIIQCKYWSKEKIIHEKHLAQLYGTYVCYCQENNLSFDSVKPIFITSTILSDKAKDFCKYLNISFKENYNLDVFPRIKCNIGTDEYGHKTKIYHLPMDQQYDKVKIDKEGECWSFTVKEAEELGFRRAYKWHSQ